MFKIILKNKYSHKNTSETSSALSTPTVSLGNKNETSSSENEENLEKDYMSEIPSKII